MRFVVDIDIIFRICMRMELQGCTQRSPRIAPPLKKRNEKRESATLFFVLSETFGYLFTRWLSVLHHIESPLISTFENGLVRIFAL